MFDNKVLPIPCPNCGKKTEKEIGWLKTHTDFVCACGAVVALNTDEIKQAIRNVEKAVAKLKSGIKRFGK